MPTPTFRRRLALWAPPIIYMGVIFSSSAQADPLPEVTAHVWDKLLHLAGYGLLGALYFRAVLGEGWAPRVAALIAVLAASLYGASDEWHQLYVAGRSSDVVDWIADSIGGALGVTALWFWSRWLGRKVSGVSRGALPD